MSILFMRHCVKSFREEGRVFAILLIGALAIGFALGLVFRALVLLPMSVILTIVSVLVAAQLDYTPWQVFFGETMSVVLLQAGYLLGLALQNETSSTSHTELLADPARMRSQSSPSKRRFPLAS
jgi:uncharacterized membrane protein YedE/YeeE